MESKVPISGGSKSPVAVGVLGDSFVDVVAIGIEKLPAWQQDVHGVLSLHTGSSSGNTAINFAKLGARTTYQCTVGDDEFGRFFVRRMESQGVVCSPKFSKQEPTPVCVVISGAKAGDRCFINSLGTNRSLLASDFLERKDELRGAAVCHIGGYFNCPKLQSADLLTLVSSLKAQGSIVSLDPQTDSLVGTWKGADSNLLQLLRLVDVFLPSEFEAQSITGTRDTAAAIAALGRLMDERALLVVKCGAEGAVAARAGRQLCSQPSFPIKVVDATGAGDAFNAAFLLAHAQGWPLQRCMQLGCAAGAMRCTIVSASDGAPTWDQLQKFLSELEAKSAPKLRSKL